MRFCNFSSVVMPYSNFSSIVMPYRNHEGLVIPYGPMLSPCADIDECATGAHECSGGQECNNRQGTYTCQCPPGHRLDHARQCQDVDECTSFYGAVSDVFYGAVTARPSMAQ